MNDYFSLYADYRKKIDEILTQSITRTLPVSLYEPLSYVLGGGGKRIRPMMVIFSCEAAGGMFEDAVNAAVALEMLHNFTLVHDDIMDNADTRRGEATVYKKWDSNVAILVGDQLIGLAYIYLLKTKSDHIRELTSAFTEGIIEVCEGQSFDKEYEERKDVAIEEYVMMIRKKTAKMLETSAAVGAFIGGAGEEFVNNIKDFALNIGLAFQIQDDLLDIIADENEFGKKKGGDVMEGKKTYLLLKALENARNGHDRDLIMKIIDNNGLKNASDEDIDEVRKVYERSGAIESARFEIARYTQLAKQCLELLPANDGKERLRWLAEMLMNRKI
jgi:geranylgeranyl diphosphate synthase type II